MFAPLRQNFIKGTWTTFVVGFQIAVVLASSLNPFELTSISLFSFASTSLVETMDLIIEVLRDDQTFRGANSSVIIFHLQFTFSQYITGLSG